MRSRINKINALMGLMVFLAVLMPGRQVPGESVSFDHISLDQGLSQATVYCILQDSKGFMWFGTQDGLNKYDGYAFKVYRTEDDNPKSLSHIYINTLFEDSEGMLWIGTNGGGLNKFDPVTETFTRYVHIAEERPVPGGDFVNAVFEDRSGTLWVGVWQSGLHTFNRETGAFTRFSPPVTGPAHRINTYIGTIFQDKGGRIWFGTRGGRMHSWDPRKQLFNTYPVPLPEQGRSGAMLVRAIYESDSQRAWVGVENGGLHILDLETGAFTRSYFHTPGDPTGLSSNAVMSLCKTRKGTLLAGTFGGGLNRLNKDGETFEVYRNVREDPESLNNNKVLSLCEDRSGMIWIGTENSGINRFKCGTAKFNLYRKTPLYPNGLNDNVIRSFLRDREGYLWVGTVSGGINRFDPKRETITHYIHNPDDPGSPAGNDVRVILEDKNGTVWVGTTRGGLNRFDRASGTFTPYLHRDGDPHGLSSSYVVSLLEARDGMLWVGTWGGGLNRFDPMKETFALYEDKRSGDPHAASNRWVFTIHEDRKGTFRLGTRNGLTHFDRESGTFACYCGDRHAPYSLTHFLVTTIHEDEDGILWFGTIGGGLNRFDPETGAFRIFKEKDGLSNNVIYGMLEDDADNLWLSSNKGLTKFNRKTYTCRNYDVYDGLQSNEFNGGAYYKSKEGEMFFGGVNGFNAFFPEKVKDNPYIPPVIITDFLIFNKPVPIAVSEAERIELDPTQNVFSFEFVALSYLDSHKNRYAYKMEGFDKDWVDAGTRRYATYTNLGHGKYTFQVKGSNNDQVWNEEGTSIKVIIHPTFWQTGWGYAMYAVLFFALLSLVRWFELTRERARVRIKESELRAKAAEAQARAIQAENMRQNMEVEEARKLQLSMLPGSLPEVPGLEIAVHMETATEVGGDYYDFHLDDDGTLAVAVGDATGHGLKAGTMVSVIKGLFCSEHTHRDIDSFFRKCTHTIKHMRLGNLYMALTLMNIKENRVNLSSAGMPPLLISRARTGAVETVTLKGTPLGAFTDAVYNSGDIRLETGDTMLLFSDGLPELFNKNGEMFGYGRVAELLEKIGPKGPEDIIAHLKSAGSQWLDGKAPDDDITFVVIKKME